MCDAFMVEAYQTFVLFAAGQPYYKFNGYCALFGELQWWKLMMFEIAKSMKVLVFGF